MSKNKTVLLKYIVIFFVIIMSILFIKENIKKKIQSHITHSGTVSCFNVNEKPKDKMTCELSSASRIGNYVVFANDKDGDQLLMYDIDSLKQKSYQRKIHPALKIPLEKPFFVKKVETTSVFENWVLAFSSYDRTTELAYTKAIAFKFNEITKTASDFHEFADEKIHKIIKKLLSENSKESIEYFKIEASAVVPNPTSEKESILLLGIREAGKSFKANENESSTKIIAVSISEKDGHVELGDDWKLLYTREHAKDFGLSSLEYNKEDKHLYALLAYEKGTNYAGKLIKISLTDLFQNKPFTSVDEVSFHDHKPEGLTYLGDNSYFIISDDDRTETPLPDGKRDVTESAFWIIKPVAK